MNWYLAKLGSLDEKRAYPATLKTLKTLQNEVLKVLRVR